MASLKNVQPSMKVWAVCVFLLSNRLDAIVDSSNDLYNEMFFYFFILKHLLFLLSVTRLM